MLVLTLMLASALGQCGPSGCPVPSRGTPSFSPAWQPALIQAMPPPAEVRRYQWLEGLDAAGNARRVWGWRRADGMVAYRPEDQAATEPEVRRAAPAAKADPVIERKPTSSIVPPKAGPAAKVGPIGAVVAEPQKPDPPSEHATAVGPDKQRIYFGVSEKQLRDTPAGYSSQGPAGRRFVEGLIGAPGDEVPDDSGKPFLTVIGTASERRPVMEAVVSGELGAVAKQMHVKEYEATSPYVLGVGLPTDGHPTILVQDAAGKTELLRKDFAPGPVELAAAIRSTAALRKPNPNFNPLKVSDGKGLDSPDATSWIGGGLLLLAALVLLFWPSRRS